MNPVSLTVSAYTRSLMSSPDAVGLFQWHQQLEWVCCKGEWIEGHFPTQQEA